MATTAITNTKLKGLRRALNTYFPNPEDTDAAEQKRKLFWEACRGVPFWYWDRQQHIDADIAAQDRARALGNPYIQCCYQHMIGLPVSKDGVENPLFPWQKLIIDTIQNNKHTAIVKSSGLGVTEILLRYLSWLCLKNDTYRNSQMMILTGPRHDLSISLIARMKGLFSRSHEIIFKSKETVIELNDCRIEAFPSKNLAASRGLPNCKYILLDEADHFETYADEAREVSERYIGKSDPHLVLVSTPAHVNSLLHRIMQEPNSIYKKLVLPYTVGLGTIYDEETILQAMRSPSFQKEYNCSFSSFGSKSVFRLEDLNAAKRLGELVGTAEQIKNKPEILYRAYKMVGIDIGYSANSKSALVILGMLEFYDGKTNTNSDIIQTLFSKTWTGQPHELLVNEIMEIFTDYHILDHETSRIYIDGSNLAMIKSLKHLAQDQENYYVQLEASRKHGWQLERMMRIIPVMFNSSAKQMMANLIHLITNKYIGIHESHTELLGDLGSAVANELALDKTTNSQDLTDAMRLAASGYKIKR